MVYRKLKNGTHAVGFVHEGKFLAYATAFDAREAKALLRAWRAVLELFHATSGAWISEDDKGKVIPRGSDSRRNKKSASQLKSRNRL